MKQSKTSTYNELIEKFESGKSAKMGYMSSYVYFNDPVRVAITAARYKFVSKMFSGLDSVLELGCGDAFYSSIVAKNVKKLVATDFDSEFIAQAKSQGRAQNMELRVLDLTKEPCENSFEGVYALDVFEHIAPENEDAFMQNICRALKKPDSHACGGGGVK